MDEIRAHSGAAVSKRNMQISDIGEGEFTIANAQPPSTPKKTAKEKKGGLGVRLCSIHPQTPKYPTGITITTTAKRMRKMRTSTTLNSFSSNFSFSGPHAQ